MVFKKVTVTNKWNSSERASRSVAPSSKQEQAGAAATATTAAAAAACSR